jgi:hypothetical protein
MYGDVRLDQWSSFRWKLVGETARCAANHMAADGQQPDWEALSGEEQTELLGHVAALFLAQDEAVKNLADQGIPF